MTTLFPTSDFLLDTRTARRLYHEVAADLPIIDYHNHLPPQAILDDHHWADLGEIWLEGDHYKWRAMRWNGIDEARITGAASSREKFDAFAETMPYLLGNPIYHWTHLELTRYFGWDRGLFSPETANAVWETGTAALAQPDFGARGLLRQMKVEFVGTTDDPCDDLAAHIAMARDPSLGFVVAPSFRPDKAFKITAPGFGAYLDRLSQVSGQTIASFDDLIAALILRLDHFAAAGCKASDHALDQMAIAPPLSAADLTRVLEAARRGQPVSFAETMAFQSTLLTEMGRAYAARDIVMQLHIGAMRNTSRRIFTTLGPDTGADSINDLSIAAPLNALLDGIEATGTLPRMVLYSLDPTRNEVIVTTAGNFQDGSLPGKIQAGTAWWYNDQLDGMERQMTQLTQMGLLSRFLGMLTDSRSFLSFPRHEYFRRLLCRMIGRWVASGEFPDHAPLLDKLVTDVCYRNARDWFTPR